MYRDEDQTAIQIHPNTVWYIDLLESKQEESLEEYRGTIPPNCQVEYNRNFITHLYLDYRKTFQSLGVLQLFNQNRVWRIHLNTQIWLDWFTCGK